MSDVLLIAGRCSPFAGIRDEARVGLFILLSLHCRRDTLTGVSLIPMGWLSEQRGRDPAFHSKNDAPSPAWAAVSVRGIYSSLAHLPLPCNPLNPLTTGLDYCQLCRASVTNGQTASSCLATTKAPARSGLLVPPAMILQSRTNTAQFTDNQVSPQLCHFKNKASLVYMDLTNMDKPQWFSY